MTKTSFLSFSRKFIKPHWGTLSLILFLTISSLLFTFISPLLLKTLVDDVFVAKNLNIFAYIIAGIIVMYLISAVSSYFNSFITGKLQLTLLKEVSECAYSAVQSAPLKSTQNIKVGDLITRIMGNTQIAINIPVRIIPQLFTCMASIFVPFLIMLSLNFQLALIIMSPVILFIVLSALFGAKMEEIQKKFLEDNAQVYSFLKENLAIIPLIKVFNLEKWSQKRFSYQMDEYYNTSITYTRTSSLNSSLSSLIMAVPVVLLIGFGGYMVIYGSLSLGTFTAFLSYTSIFFTPISQLSGIWTSYKSALPAFDRIEEILDLEEKESRTQSLAIDEGTIELDDVWFSYHHRKVLKGFQATFTQGLNYIVGDNGKGKSTILKLICNLYNVDKGCIKIDGQDISQVERESLRSSISMIFSETYLFDGSIYDNILIGNLDASQEDVVRVAKMVKLHEFVLSTPQKYDTPVGEGGLMLSSGEKQKIALARAVLKNSPIILLDEVTKSIDADSRKAINQVISILKNEKTVIIVTHHEGDRVAEGNVIPIK
ncbi:ABC transporter ATP-binding protein [Methanobacterium sp. BAmetb5]|uniref:ABC transporter ATP-binding protein n=1 Tax=Methanobacterium sp. BAmetb5 TaxID=2025351 RepID=UPI000E8F522B|nr:ABC transporter ATP-binding protein [Methanobacterium sp. BAmetb5]AXV39123.1 MAG: multidrug ABC transporter ATP-binding protein [Methanobacterium sp. BAmetb5]